MMDEGIIRYEQRRCATEGCNTVLSVSNEGDYCRPCKHSRVGKLSSDFVTLVNNANSMQTKLLARIWEGEKVVEEC